MLNNLNDLVIELKKKNGLAYFNSQKTEIITLCPKCEHTKFFKNPSHGHLYISTETPLFNCFKCSDYKGMLLKLLNEYEIENKYFDTSNINITNYVSNKELSISNDIRVPKYKENAKAHELKVKYLNNRFRNKIELKNIEGLILNIETFVNENNINVSNYKSSFLKYLYGNFVGFLSTRKSIVVCRNIDTKSEFAHFKLKLNKNLFFKDFYGIEINKINYENDNICDIILSEGIFDLYNFIYSKYYKSKNLNLHFAAAGLNKPNDELLLSVLDYLKVFKVNIHLLSDNDVEDKEYKNIYFNPCVENVYIYRNKLDKDIGSKKLSIISYKLNNNILYNTTTDWRKCINA